MHLPLFKRAALVSLCFVAAVASSLRGQQNDPPVGVAVKIYARAASGSGSVGLSGTFLASSPGASDAYASASGATNAVLGTAGVVRLEPGKSYTLSASSSGVTGPTVNVVPPPGYHVVMDGIIRSAEPYSGSAMMTLQIQPLGVRHPGLAGMVSSVASDEVEWRLSLGALRNGGSAGEIALIDTGTRSDWAPIFTPAMLSYEAVSDEVSVYRPSNIIRQIIANQVVVDVVTINSTSYELRCYHPTQMQGSTDPRTFTGSPYETYRIGQGATATTLSFTRETRNVTDATSTFPVARRETMSLTRSGAWPNHAWTRQDWTLENQPSLSNTVVQSTGTGGIRSEAIKVYTPATGAIALTATRTYNVLGNLGETLAAETVGTATGLTATFGYYPDYTNFGSFGYLQTAVLPGGNWVAYDYYDTDVASGFRGGRVKYQYKPYVDAPAVLTKNANLGQVTYYEYVDDVFGARTRPSLAETRINGTLTAKSATSYSDSYATVNGFGITQSTRSDYSAVTKNLQTITRSYRPDVSDAFIRGQLYSVTKPDGVMQSFGYQRGTWDGTTFTAGSGAIGTGTASKLSVITGSANGAAGTACSALGSQTIDTIYLVDGKSKMDVTIRDSRALVARTESHVWKNNAWQLVSSTICTYDYAGRLLTRTGSNGSLYTAIYDGGLKTSETDESGVTTDYSYDAANRVNTSTRRGILPIASLATHFEYDAMGHVTEEHVGWGQVEKLVTKRTYDDAGRIKTEAPPANYGAVAHTYDPANRVHTVTHADTTTEIATDYLDGRAYSTTGTAVVPSYHTYGVETILDQTNGWQWHKVNTGTSSSARWQKSWTDWLGRDRKSEHPGYTGQPNVVEQSVYEDTTGHLLQKSSNVLTASTLYEYNLLGQVSRSGIDFDNNGRLELASTDRITEAETFLESYNGAWWMRTENRTYPNMGSSAKIVTSATRTRLTGHGVNRLAESQDIDAEGNVTTTYTDVARSAGRSTRTTLKTGITGSMTETSVNGLLRSVSGFDGLITTTDYDALLRRKSVTDSRNNPNTTGYVSGTKLVQTVIDGGGYVTTSAYDAMGRVIWTRDPRNAYTQSSYNARGQLLRQWGSGTMPVEYGYDSTYGDRTSMKTFRGGTNWGQDFTGSNPQPVDWPGTGSNMSGSTGTADTTTWTFDGPSGLLTTKTDALNRAVTQTYNARGQTATRTLARTVTTTYGYDNATGELLTQTYSDSTPSVTYTYGRTGQTETIADYTGTRDLVYDPVRTWRLSAEAESSFYGGRVVTRLYDESMMIGRVRGFEVGSAAGSNTDLEQDFGFTPVGRFDTIITKRDGDGTGRTFRYGYLSNAAMLQSVAIDQGAGPGGHPFTITRNYDAQRDLITSLETKWSTTSRTKYVYAYDERGQRSSVVQTGDVFNDYYDSSHQGVFRLFTYDGRGEVTQDIGYSGTNIADQSSPLNGRRHEFDYDNAQNRNWSNRTGNSTLRDDYTTNALNQYVTRENNTVPVSGTAAPDTGGAGGTAVVVTGGTLTPATAGRQGSTRYWNDELTVNNNADPMNPNPWRGTLNIFTAKRGTGGGADVFKVEARTAEIAARLQSFTYDDDGNLTSDGVWDYTWDAENRLVGMTTTTVAAAFGYPQRAMEYRYDYMGRRVQKRVLDASVTPAVEISSRRYLYDGWNLVAEYNAPNGSSIGSLIRSYTWGLDIALSMTNAGGVGALLQVADHASGKTYLPAYDGNGDIMALFNAATGAQAAAYEYGPFGETLRAQISDSTLTEQPFRFSTKFTDQETGLVYYGRRYYDSKNGRFLGRDPKEEDGGINLYGFCGNNSINHWDRLGLADQPTKMDPFEVNDTLVMNADGAGGGGGLGGLMSGVSGGGTSYNPFNYSGPILFPGAIVKDSKGNRYVVTESAGKDEKGNLVWNAVPEKDYAAGQLAAATAAVNQSQANLNVSTTEMAAEFAKGAATAIAITVAITATGGTAAPVIGLILAGASGVQTIGTYIDMNTNPQKYTPGQVANTTAGATGAILTGAALGSLLSGGNSAPAPGSPDFVGPVTGESLVSSVGSPGSPGVRVVDSPQALVDLFNVVSQGGTPVQNSYPGTMVRLPDGTLVGLRATSRSGGPTLDFFPPSGVNLKVHVSQTPVTPAPVTPAPVSPPPAPSPGGPTP